MQNCVDHLPIGHLPDLNEADEDGELQIVGGCHSDDFVGPLDLTIRRTHDVRHFVIDDCYRRLLLQYVGFVNCCVSITVLLFLLLLSYLTNCNAINRCHQIELYIILYIFIEDNGWMECTRRRCRGVGRTSAGWWVSYTHTHTHAHREYTIHRHKHIDYSIYM